MKNDFVSNNVIPQQNKHIHSWVLVSKSLALILMLKFITDLLLLLSFSILANIISEHQIIFLCQNVNNKPNARNI